MNRQEGIMTRIDYEIVTAAGVTVRTFESEEVARDWLKERRVELPGAFVEGVERSERRWTVYTPRLKLVA